MLCDIFIYLENLSASYPISDFQYFIVTGYLLLKIESFFRGYWAYVKKTCIQLYVTDIKELNNI